MNESDARPLPTRAKPKRMTKRSLMLTAGAAAAVSFALPWVTIGALPKSLTPADRQVIVVPAGGQVVVSSGTTQTGTGVTLGSASTAPVVTTTRASAPAPPGA
jgi:hypothetical protein